MRISAYEWRFNFVLGLNAVESLYTIILQHIICMFSVVQEKVFLEQPYNPCSASVRFSCFSSGSANPSLTIRRKCVLLAQMWENLYFDVISSHETLIMDEFQPKTNMHISVFSSRNGSPNIY